jgi:hypothetical protein
MQTFNNETLLPAAEHAALVAALRSFLPEDSVLFAPEDLKPYECDGLSAYKRLPAVVVLPQNEDEVRRVLAICNARRVPVVARGAGTGLSGGAHRRPPPNHPPRSSRPPSTRTLPCLTRQTAYRWGQPLEAEPLGG